MARHTDRTPPSATVIRRISKQWAELFNQRFLVGLVSEEHMRACIQRAMSPPDPFEVLSHRLLSPRQQLLELERFNREYWGGRVLTRQHFENALASLDLLKQTVPDPQQGVRTLYHFHAQGATLADTMTMWRKVWLGEFGSCLSDRYGVLSDAAGVSRPATGQYRYRRVEGRTWPEMGAGIFLRAINMASYLGPITETSVAEIRRESVGTLAADEVFSVLGTHKPLLWAMAEGQFAPIYIPGIEVCTSGNDDWSKLIVLYPVGGGLQITTDYYTAIQRGQSAVPLLLG